MTTIEISRIAHVVNDEAAETLLKKCGTGSIDYDSLYVITAPMNDCDWYLIRDWAEEHGLLAN